MKINEEQKQTMNKNLDNLAQQIICACTQKNQIIPVVGYNATGKTNLLQIIKRRLSFEQEWNLLDLDQQPFSMQKNQKQQLSSWNHFVLNLIDAKAFTEKFYKEQALQAFVQIFFVNGKNLAYRHTNEQMNLKEQILHDWLNYQSLEKILFIDLPSGQRFLKTLELLAQWIDKLHQLKLFNNNLKHLIILESPEQFGHIALVNKIAKVLYQINQMQVNIVLTTHSPELVHQFYRSNRLNDAQTIKTLKLLEKDAFFIADFTKSSQIGILNSRDLKMLVQALFDENVFLVEGLKEYELINQLMDHDFPEHFYNVYDCQGKAVVKKRLAFLLHFRINHSCFVLFDRDLKNQSPEQKQRSQHYLNAVKQLYQQQQLEPYYYQVENNIEDFLHQDGAKNDLHLVHYDYIKKLPHYGDLKMALNIFLNYQKLKI